VTFAEQILSIANRYACKQTVAHQQSKIAFDIGGEPGSRLAAFLEISTSPDTLLRLVQNAPEDNPKTPQVLGVDDWAM
jgi:hypothetical protein